MVQSYHGVLHARHHHFIHRNWYEWYSPSAADRKLYKRFEHGHLQRALQHANDEYGCSFISRGGSEAVGDFMQEILRVPAKPRQK